MVVKKDDGKVPALLLLAAVTFESWSEGVSEMDGGDGLLLPSLIVVGNALVQQ